MGKIHVLNFETANLIAAGEVVDRPASVMKELLENAVDAGARHITAEVRHGGVALLRVTDDGCGMTAEDLPVALRRHATSKIRSREDLDGILTLGFRGEALAAIASVSKISILSRVKGAAMGTLLEAEGGSVHDVTEVGCAEGTTVLVEELFYNVPARRKFLKKDATETLAVLSVAEKLALSRPDIALSFIADGNLRFATAGDGNLMNALYAVLGREFAQKLLSVSGGSSGIRVTGFIGRSDNTRNNRNYQNVFINGRYVKSRTVMAALEQAYTSYIAPEKFPVCALFLEIAPETVDVNVHPAKLEVKFTDERAIFEAVYYAVRAALENAAFRPDLSLSKKEEKRNELLHRFTPIGDRPKEQLRFGSDALTHTQKTEQAPAPTPASVRPSVPPMLRVTGTQETKQGVAASAGAQLSPEETREILDIYRSTARPPQEAAAVRSPSPFAKSDAVPLSHTPLAPKEGNEAPKAPEEAASPFSKELPPYRLLGDAFHCYLFVETEGRLLLIDQHAAHERILFEELLLEQKRAGHVTAQNLLLPLSVKLSPEERSAALECREELMLAGFEYELTEASDTCDITAVPSLIDTEKAVALFTELCAGIQRGVADPQITIEKRRERALYQIACKAAIKGGRAYDREHHIWLVEKLLRLPDITVCPHGRPVAVALTKDELDRRFDRIK